MTNLDATIAKLRALPEKQQDAVAAQIDFMLGEGAEEALTAQQWAAIEARLDSAEGFSPHDEVERSFRDRFR